MTLLDFICCWFDISSTLIYYSSTSANSFYLPLGFSDCILPRLCLLWQSKTGPIVVGNQKILKDEGRTHLNKENLKFMIWDLVFFLSTFIHFYPLVSTFMQWNQVITGTVYLLYEDIQNFCVCMENKKFESGTYLLIIIFQCHPLHGKPDRCLKLNKHLMCPSKWSRLYLKLIFSSSFIFSTVFNSSSSPLSKISTQWSFWKCYQAVIRWDGLDWMRWRAGLCP